MATIPKIRFEKSGYYFIGLLILAFLGFWKSYFSNFFEGKSDFSFYFHFHAVLMLLWILMLIIQPLLIRKKQLHLHRLIGKSSYFIMPLVIISIVLILNSGLKGIPADKININKFLFPCRDILLLISAFSIGIWYRHKIQIHARAMIITGIVLIEPALFRFLRSMVFVGMGSVGARIGMVLIVGLLIGFMIFERNQKSGRWLFPALLVVDLAVFAVPVFSIHLTFLKPFIQWFAELPLT